MRVIEMLGRSFWGTEEGLAGVRGESEKHRQALLERLEMSEESQTVNNAAVKPEEVGQEERRGNAGGNEDYEVQELGGDA